MKELSEATALVVDHGAFLPLARRIARDFKRVLYYTPWEKSAPTVNDCAVGHGFPDIERVDDIFKVRKEIDVAVFPDVLHAGLQLDLEERGIPVWGARAGDRLELDRVLFHKTLDGLGLDVPEFEQAMGLMALRRTLRDKKDVYIKISRFRGTMETKHWRDYRSDGVWLDYMAVKLGPFAEKLRFLIFKKIDTDLEIGADTYSVDGKWPGVMLQGYEWKDKGYIAAVTKRDKLPEPLRDILTAFSPVLAGQRYRQQWSMEVRVLDDKAYFIDATCRGGLPSTASQCEAWANFSEIIWHGAHGELVEPQPTCKFTCESIVSLKTPAGTWGKLYVPPELEDNLKLCACGMADGAHCWPPHEQAVLASNEPEVGWLVTCGDFLADTVQAHIEMMGRLPDGLSADKFSMAELLEEIQKAEATGLEFTKQPVPDPEIVLSE